MKYFNALFYVCIICLSCKNDKTVIITDSQLDINDLKREIIYENDKEAYGVFLDVSSNDSLNYDALPVSLMIADQNVNNSLASQMVFYKMVSLANNNKFDLKNLYKLSEVNRNFAMYYLLQSAKLQNMASQMYLEEIYRFGIGFEKNEFKADSILRIIKSDDNRFIPLYIRRENSNKKSS